MTMLCVLCRIRCMAPMKERVALLARMPPRRTSGASSRNHNTSALASAICSISETNAWLALQLKKKEQRMNSIEIPVKADIPAHVPPELVFDFDYNTDPAYCSDPHARAEDLLETAPPIFWSPYNNGHWIIQKYDACYEALRDAA